MLMFKWKNNKTEIFISLWEWCPTWCQSCSRTIAQIKSFNLKELKEQIDISNSLSDDTFSYFLYWTNNIKNNEINDIINYIESINRNYRIQIPLDSKKEDLDKLINKQKINEFVISKKIKEKEELRDIIKSIKEFYKIPNIIINYDLLIKKEFIHALEKILKIRFNENDDKTLEGVIWNININLRELYNINYKNKKIDDLNLKSCFVYDSFNIKKDHIEILDHYEIDRNLDICFHNPLCYIWNNKIANMKQERKKLISNFEKYKNHYLKDLNSDFEKNCFICISNWFNYRKD